jgi:ribosomal protein S18 acetylase RimI-like enzyme
MPRLQIDHYTNPSAFYSTTGAFLMEREIENNVSIGLVLNAIRGDIPTIHMWRVHDGERVLGAAVLTPGRKVNLVTPATEIASALAERLYRDGIDAPGIRGEPAACTRFCETWTRLSNQGAKIEMPQLLYQLDRVIPVSGVRGEMRRGTVRERALLIDWMDAFSVETFGPQRAAMSEEYVDRALRAEDGRGIWVWEVDNHPVSTVSVNRLTPHGAVVSGVYTPPEHRRNGYAGALTAEVSAHMLASGRKWCTLYTDRSNPTSNKIYQQIGYYVVAEQEDWGFGD